MGKKLPPPLPPPPSPPPPPAKKKGRLVPSCLFAQETGLKNSAGHSKTLDLFFHCLLQFLGDFFALGRKGLCRLPSRAAGLFKGAFEHRDLLLPTTQGLELLLNCFLDLQNIINRAVVLSLKPFDLGEPVLQLLEGARIELDLSGIAPENGGRLLQLSLRGVEQFDGLV